MVSSFFITPFPFFSFTILKKYTSEYMLIQQDQLLILVILIRSIHMSVRSVHKKEHSSLFVIIFMACVLLILSFFLFFTSQKEIFPSFTKACQIHTHALQQHYTTVLLPGSGNNLSRQTLNANLQKILTSDMSNDTRLVLAQESLASSKELSDQIVSIAKHTRTLETSLKELSLLLKINTIPRNTRSLIEEIVFDTEKYLELTATIEKLLFTIHNQSHSIFIRIIREKGDLSPSHIEDLNENIPLAEHNFDQLSSSYKDIAMLQDVIQKKCINTN